MKTKNLPKIFLFAVVIILASCSRLDPFDLLGRYSHWDLSMGIENKTVTKLVVEYDGDFVNEFGQYDHYVQTISVNSTGGIYLGNCTGDKNLEFPLEEDVLKRMEDVVVYRYVEGGKQYLPRKYFENLVYYEVTDNGWDMGAEMINYHITITEDMFTE